MTSQLRVEVKRVGIRGQTWPFHSSRSNVGTNYKQCILVNGRNPPNYLTIQRHWVCIYSLFKKKTLI